MEVTTVFRAIAAGLMGLFLAARPVTGTQALAADGKPDLSDARIAAILKTRVETEHAASGVVVGVIDASGRRVIAAGAPGPGGRPLDGDTLFEIGSVTKAYTALLLADMVRRGEVRLDDPAAKYLPPGATLPQRDGKAITLIDLATHTSGLPRLPTDFAPKDMADPYADYDDAKLYASLREARLESRPGAAYAYSNLGAGLLGQLLARRAGMTYPALVQARITGPLGLKDTAIALTPDQKARLTTGHDAQLSPVGYWALDSLAGAGALRSTANDQLAFLAAELGYVDTPLKAAMADQLVPRRPAGKGQVALGWHVARGPRGDIFWHNGGTGGFRSFVGFDKARGVGVVVLVDTASEAGGDDIAMHLLTGAPLSKPPAQRQAIAVKAADLERFVGRYKLAPSMIVTVTRQDDHLFAQLTDQPVFEIFPESPTAFFWKVVDAQVTFQLAPDGKVTGLVLHQGGQNAPGPRQP